MINQFLFLKMNDIDADDNCFQQDGATCHTDSQAINLFNEKFGEAIISGNEPVNWPHQDHPI